MNPSEPPHADLSAYLAQPSEAEVEFRRLFRPGEKLVICDIGACEGEDSIRFARAFPRAQVFAFEPLPTNIREIERNLAAYDARSVSLVPVALSDRTGEAEFHVSSGRPPDSGNLAWNFGNKSSSLLEPSASNAPNPWLRFEERIRVPTQTLDDFCRSHGIERIDFIQLDVQGAEQRVLTGATAMLPGITAIWLEVACREHYRGQPLAGDIQRYMHDRGFRLAHASYRDPRFGEGDHLYVNVRHFRTWRYLVRRKIQRIATALRRKLSGSLSSP